MVLPPEGPLAGYFELPESIGLIHRGPRNTHAEAKRYVQQALAIDPALPDAHSALGVIYLFHDWDWPGVERELSRALEIDPNVNMTRNLYGFYLAAMGRLPEALASIQRGQELDPLAAPRRFELAQCYTWMRQYDQAIAEARKALDLDPNFFPAYGELGQALHSRACTRNVAELQKPGGVSKNTRGFLGRLGYAYAMAGQRAAAERVLEELKDPGKSRFGYALAIARITRLLVRNTWPASGFRKPATNVTLP